MNAELLRQALDLLEQEVKSRPSAVEFEMAYQVRVAMDRIRFAIKHSEQYGPHTDQMHEAGLQLLDAIDRLESAERHFQKRFRPALGGHVSQTQPTNGKRQPGQRDSA